MNSERRLGVVLAVFVNPDFVSRDSIIPLGIMANDIVVDSILQNAINIRTKNHFLHDNGVIGRRLGFNVKSVRNLTNNPHKTKSLEAEGISVEEVIPIEAVKLDKFNMAQLYMKKKTLGHEFYSFDINDPKIIELFNDSMKKSCFSEYDSYLWEC